MLAAPAEATEVKLLEESTDPFAAGAAVRDDPAGRREGIAGFFRVGRAFGPDGARLHQQPLDLLGRHHPDPDAQDPRPDRGQLAARRCPVVTLHATTVAQPLTAPAAIVPAVTESAYRSPAPTLYSYCDPFQRYNEIQIQKESTHTAHQHV